MFSTQVARIVVFVSTVSLAVSAAIAQPTSHTVRVSRYPWMDQHPLPFAGRSAPVALASHASAPYLLAPDFDEPAIDVPATDESIFDPLPAPNEIFDGQSACCEPVCESRCQCCYNYCCDPSRTWTARVGAMFLHRARPDTQPLFSDPAIVGSGINANGFNPGWGTGIDASLIRHRVFQTNSDLELRYFGIDTWNATQSMRLNGNPLMIHNNPPTFITGGRDISSQYSLSLLNTELNSRRRIGNNWTLLGGLRYVQFNEQLNTQLINGPGVGDVHYNVNANNDLFGFQAGLLYDVCSTCDCCVQLYGKAGIYANHATQNTSLTNFSAPAATFAVNGGSTQVAGVGEVGITGSKRIWRNLALRGGYQVFVLDGVATAPGQFPASSFVSQSGLGNNDTVVFHGATIGLELTY